MKLESEREYQETEGEGADDGERDRDGGELNLADVTDKDISDGANTVLADDVKSHRSSYRPHLSRLCRQNSLDIDPAPGRSIILFYFATVRKQRRRRRIHLLKMINLSLLSLISSLYL